LGGFLPLRFQGFGILTLPIPVKWKQYLALDCPVIKTSTHVVWHFAASWEASTRIHDQLAWVANNPAKFAITFEYGRGQNNKTQGSFNYQIRATY